MNTNTIYDLMEAIFLCEDLIECGSMLITFSEECMQSPNRPKLVNTFKQRLIGSNSFRVLNFLNPNDYYCLSGRHAVIQHLMLWTNQQLPPVKFLQQLTQLGETMKMEFLPPTGRCVTEEFIHDITVYLNDEFNFTSLICGDFVPVYLMLNNSHQEYNSIYPITKAEGEAGHDYIILYHVKPDPNREVLPEFVFLHELGHIVQMKYGAASRPPESFYSILSEKALQHTPDQICEYFADTFAMGVLCNSPFEEYDCYKDIPKSIKVKNREYIASLLLQQQ